jgi:hypothetical protein
VAATTSQWGVVSDDPQRFGGYKYFASHVAVAGHIMTSGIRTVPTGDSAHTVAVDNQAGATFRFVGTNVSETYTPDDADDYAAIYCGTFNMQPTGSYDGDGELAFRMKAIDSLSGGSGLTTTFSISADNFYRGVVLYNGVYQILDSATFVIYRGINHPDLTQHMGLQVKGGIVTNWHEGHLCSFSAAYG